MHLSKLIELVHLRSVNFTENCNSIKTNFVKNKTSSSQTFCYYLLSLQTVTLTFRAPLLETPSFWMLPKGRTSPFPFSFFHAFIHTHCRDTIQLNSYIQDSFPSKCGEHSFCSLRECVCSQWFTRYQPLPTANYFTLSSETKQNQIAYLKIS